MASQFTVLVLVAAAISIAFSIIRSVDSALCNQACPVSSLTIVPYPFGFSEGCQIRLNCTDSGAILIGDFRVQTITKDNIFVEVPPACNRPTETLVQLYGDNYAPALQNVLLLINCSYHSVQCPIKQSDLDAMLSSETCKGTNKDNVICISDAYKGVSELLGHIEENDDCQIFFSSIAVQQLPPEVEVIMLKWGLRSCQCSANANSVVVPLPNSMTGCRCECQKGFKGDGYLYPDSVGCEEDDAGFILIAVISAVLAVILLASLILVSYVWRMKGKFTLINKKKVDTNAVEKEDLELPLFDFATIAKATNNFSANKKLGEGGFGPVYKGVLEEGQEIAIKRLSKSSKQGLEELKNEVIFIAKLQHRNLVKLLGCCIEGDEKMLIYEYMPNKSLDSFIFDPKHEKTLDWTKRVQIIDGIVRGLIYLHQDSRLRIIHRDLKASNILLDNDMNPKISDFGLARSFGANETEGNTNKVVGTYGYMPPEYVIDGHYSTKSDVFSFGVLVLEILSGKRNRGFFGKDDNLNLLGHAWRLFTECRCLDLIDTSMGDAFNPSEALRLFHVGLLCVQQSPEDRPCMSSVLLMLGGEGTLPQPKQPGFYIKRDVLQSKSPSSNHEIHSVNEVTMTPLQAR